MLHTIGSNGHALILWLAAGLAADRQRFVPGWGLWRPQTARSVFLRLAPPENWPRPLSLIAALLRPGAGSDAALLAHGLSKADWQRFADLATERHRIAPVIVSGLGALEMPDEIRERLRRSARENAARTLEQMAETRRIADALTGLGIKPVVFKGWPLAERLYGSAAARHTGDLDLLIPEDRLAACCAAMADLGYRPDRHHRGNVRIAASRALREDGKDIKFLHPMTGLAVELHWHLYPFRGWPDPLAHPAALERQRTGIGILQSPSDAANMQYLSIHGTLHLWARLKWLADIARLAQRRGLVELEADVERARALNILTPVALALRLSARLFASPLPRSLSASDSGLMRIEAWMLDAMTRDDTIPVITRRYRIWVRLMAFRLAATRAQFFGALRYDTVRRVRLGAAHLANRLTGE